MVDYFRQASPITKATLIGVFNDVKILTQLFVAPFGLASTTLDILGQELAIDEYSKLFRLWEEFLSRKVYLTQGVAEGCIDH